MPRVGDIVRATGSGNGTPPLQFAWDFGDGTLVAGMQAAHAYVAPGSYRVTFTVRDATRQYRPRLVAGYRFCSNIVFGTQPGSGL